MHTKSDNEEFINVSDTDEIIKGLFESFLQKYEENLQEKMKGSDFDFLYYDFNKISINSGGSYIDSPKWIKNKKSTINPKNNDYKCFQYAVTLALNLDKVSSHPERMSKIKPFIEQYNWKEIDFPSTSKDSIYLIFCAYLIILKKYKLLINQNIIREKQVILLMITDGENWHYLVVKNVPGLLKGITSNHKEDFYCLNCFHSYRTKHKLEEHKKICENHDYCHVEMPTKDNNIIKYNQG